MVDFLYAGKNSVNQVHGYNNLEVTLKNILQADNRVIFNFDTTDLSKLDLKKENLNLAVIEIDRFLSIESKGKSYTLPERSKDFVVYKNVGDENKFSVVFSFEKKMERFYYDLQINDKFRYEGKVDFNLLANDHVRLETDY